LLGFRELQDDEKAMAFTDRSQIVRKHDRGSTHRAKEMFAGILLGVLIAALGIRSVLPTDALVPAVVTLLFALGAATAGFALLCRRNQARTMWFDIAGILTFVGVAVSILIEPDQMVRLLMLSDQPD
jgi:uncharacterized membrane protein HdeD (DUF308 family)